MTTWQAVVDQHGPLVWRLAHRLLGNEPDAADCYQTVFFEAFEASKREEIHNWPGFLTRVTTTRAIDVLRVRFRHCEPEAEAALREAPAPVTDGPQETAEWHELIGRFRAGLAQLPTENAQVFCLRYFEQMSNQELAVQLETNANHIGVLMYRAREALQKFLGEATRRA